MAHLRRCVRSRQAVSSELSLRRAGAETIVVALASVPVLDPQSRVTHLETTIIDITRQKQAEAALLASERDLRALIDASPHPIQLKDGAGRWLLANPAALELYELTGVDYRNKRDSELAARAPFYRAALLKREEADRAILQGGQSCRTNEIVPKPDGSARSIDFIKVPDGEKFGVER